MVKNENITLKGLKMTFSSLLLGTLLIIPFIYSTKEYKGNIEKYKVKYYRNIFGERIEIINNDSYKLIEESSINKIYRERISGKKELIYNEILGFEIENSISKKEIQELKNFCNNIKKEIYKKK